MLQWATTVRVSCGRRLLDHNPLQGIRNVREQNERRPVATWERFTATRKAAQTFALEASTTAKRDLWIRLELAVVLAEATGRRIGSIRQLRWEDINLSDGRILWRAEADKKRQEWNVPIPPALVEELRSFRNQLGAVAGWVFPDNQDASKPMSRDALDVLLLKAEAKAELTKLDGGLWHPYRRKWATERKDEPVKDVAAAGGWKDVGTLINRYQQADDETMLRVMSVPKKLIGQAING